MSVRSRAIRSKQLPQGAADSPSITATVASGPETMPQPSVITPGTGPVRSINIVYPAKREEELIFWSPFARMGLHFDIGWLGVYLLGYIPAMALGKWALRVP